MSDGMDKAKKNFWDYACNYFFMGHDGVLETYRSYHPSDDEEREWRKEYIESWIPRISVEDFEAVNKLTAAHAVEAIPYILDIVDDGDSFTKLMLANAIHELSGYPGVDTSLQIKAQIKVKELYQIILSTPVIITDEHKQEIIPLLTILNANSEEEYVISFAKARLESVG